MLTRVAAFALRVKAYSRSLLVHYHHYFGFVLVAVEKVPLVFPHGTTQVFTMNLQGFLNFVVASLLAFSHVAFYQFSPCTVILYLLLKLSGFLECFSERTHFIFLISYGKPSTTQNTNYERATNM